MHNQAYQLILGSSSPFRAAILDKIRLRYQVVTPDIDETPLEHESVLTYVTRLSIEKAQAVSSKLGQGRYMIISSDQVACDQNGTIYAKPANIRSAAEMLQKLSGQYIFYHCAVSLMSTSTHQIYTDISTTTVKFKVLSNDLISWYLNNEPHALLCSSGLCIESLGPILLDEFTSTDPVSCQGLPILTVDKLLLRHQLSLCHFISASEEVVI
jgi:septum formation protein